MVSQFGHDVFFEAYGAVEVLRVRRVVRSTICKHPLHVRDEQTAIAVVVGLETLRHCFEVHGVLDVVVVVGDNFSIDGEEEGPRGGVVFGSVEDGLESVVQHVGIVGGPGVGTATDAFVGRDPAGFEDS